MKIALVVNRAAGSADDANEDALAAELSALGHVERVAPASPESFGSEVRTAGAASDLVVIAGGDGTLNMAVNSLRGRLSDIAFALIPIGTGNDLARTLDLSLDPVDAARSIVRGRERLLDVGLARGPDLERLFVNACMGGFPVQVDAAIHEETKRRFGAAAFWVGGMKAATDLRRAVVSINGTEIHDCLAVGVGNGRTCGGGFEVWPDAKPDDGLLNACAMAASNIAAAARLAVGVKSGNHTHMEDVVSVEREEIEVSSEPEIEINVDGELIGLRTPARFEVFGQLRWRGP